MKTKSKEKVYAERQHSYKQEKRGNFQKSPCFCTKKRQKIRR